MPTCSPGARPATTGPGCPRLSGAPLGEHLPDVVVLPTTASQISEVVKLANRHRIGGAPGGRHRAGRQGGAATGRDLVDVKLMNRILDIDMEDRTVTVQPGINMLKLNERLRPYGVFYPDDPASFPCSIVGGRIGTSGWSRSAAATATPATWLSVSRSAFPPES